MRIIEDLSRTAIVLLLAGFMVVALSGPKAVPAAEYDWVDAMMQAVLIEQTNQGPFGGVFAPYVAQLTTVRAHVVNGEREAVYQAMNRFMQMLEGREAGILPEVADRLFDLCYLVTPAQFHDVSRHLHRFSQQQAGVATS